MPTPAFKNPGLVNGKIFPGPQRLRVQGPKVVSLPRYSFISDSPLQGTVTHHGLAWYSSHYPRHSWSGCLLSLHQWTQQQPEHAAFIRLHSELQSGTSCPVDVTPASRALTKRRLYLEELTLQQSSHTQRSTRVSLLTLECMGGSCVCLEGLSILPRSFSLSKMPHNTGDNNGEEDPGLQLYSYPQHLPAQETSVDQEAISCCLVKKTLFG